MSNTGKATFSLTADFNEKVEPADQDASDSDCFNIGYFFLQDIMKGLLLKDYFRQKTDSRKVTFDCFATSRFLTYARILESCSKLASGTIWVLTMSSRTLITSISSASWISWLKIMTVISPGFIKTAVPLCGGTLPSATMTAPISTLNANSRMRISWMKLPARLSTA